MSMVRFTMLAVTILSLAASLHAQIPYVKSDSLINAGIALHDDKKYEESIHLFDMVPQGDTLYYSALAEKVNSLVGLEKNEEAIAIARGLIKRKIITRAIMYIALGNAYDNLGKSDSAIWFYQEGIKQYPYENMLYYNLGTTYGNLGRYDEAISAYQESIKISPFHSTSHLSLAIITARMGLYTKTHLALSTYLALVPNNNQALVALNDMFIGNWTLFETEENTVDNSDFEELDLIIRSKAATDDKFKSNIKFKAPVAQQSELILEMLEYKDQSEDFWMQYYVPMYAQIQADGLASAFIYHILTSADNDDIAKWIKQHDKELESFYAVANTYLNKIRNTRTAVVGGIENEYTCWYYDNKKFNAIGRENAAGDNIGPYEFYYPNQEPQAIGTYDDRGYKTGKWTYYHENGVVSKTEEFESNGDLIKPVHTFYENGKPKSVIPYAENQPEGLVKFYYPAGLLREELMASEGMKHGKGTGYYPTGAKNMEYEYEQGSLTGQFIYYFPTGELSQELTYENDTLNGPFRDYFFNGVLYQEGVYKNGLAEGLWVFRYRNGEKSAEGSYAADERTGVWKYYDTEGRLTEEETYNDAGMVVREQIFDPEDGKVHYEHIMNDQEELIAYTFFDKSGKVLSQEENKNGNLTYNGYYPDGKKWIKGTYKNGNKNGSFTYYSYFGVISSEIEFKEDEYDGSYKVFNENGNLSQELSYTEGTQNGYTREFFEDGSLQREGWTIDGSKQQTWKEYHLNGELSMEYYVLNNEYNGPVKTYDPQGRLVLIEEYSEGLVTHADQYDTLGHIYHSFDLDYGTGEYYLKYAGGPVRTKINLAGSQKSTDVTEYSRDGKLLVTYPVREGSYNGEFTDYHTNGAISIKGTYQNDEATGTWTYFSREGNKIRETDYESGQLHGVRTWHENGQLEMNREYAYDEPIGSSKYYSPDGTLVIEKLYNKYGIRGYRYLNAQGSLTDVIAFDGTGEVKAYFPDGSISTIQHYTNGIFDGEYIEYHTNGQVRVKRTYKNGIQTGSEEEYYADGTIKFRANYKQDELEGNVMTFYPNGKTRHMSQYVTGIRHGKAIYFDENGKITEQLMYVNGQWY